MDFKQIATFVEVADLRSFSKAAEKMYITQPTVTSQIKRLEQELNTLLFNRTGRKVALTHTGEMFYDYAKEMINLKLFITNKINQHKEELRGTLVVSASHIPQQYILPKLMKEFLHLYPQIKVEIITADSQTVFQQIKNGFSNLGIVDEKLNGKNIECFELIKDEIVLALPQSYKSRFKLYETIELDQLRTIPLIMRENDQGLKNMLKNQLEKQNFSMSDLNTIVQVFTNDTSKNMVKQDVGASLLSKLTIEKEIESGEIIPVHIQKLILERKFYFATYKNKNIPVVCKKFKDFVVNKVKQ